MVKMYEAPSSRTSPIGARGSRRRVGGRPPGGSSAGPGIRAVSSPEVLEIVLVRLRVIGEPTRVQIMALLDRLGTATVQEITDQLPSVPSTRQNVAKHLRTLYEAGLVARQRDGNRVQYRLVDWSALWLIDQIAQSVATHLESRHETLRGTP